VIKEIVLRNGSLVEKTPLPEIKYDETSTYFAQHPETGGIYHLHRVNAERKLGIHYCWIPLWRSNMEYDFYSAPSPEEAIRVVLRYHFRVIMLDGNRESLDAVTSFFNNKNS
jgi:hypothetical protein